MSAIRQAREAAAEAIRERSARAASRYSNLSHNEELARFDRARPEAAARRLLRNHGMNPHINTNPLRKPAFFKNMSQTMNPMRRLYRSAHGRRRSGRRGRGTRRR